MHLKYLLLLVALALVFGVFYVWNPGNRIQGGLAAATTEPASSGAADGAGKPPDAVPVVVAPVSQADVPIFLSGIGTVTAYITIEAKAQVDGMILRLNFQEGEDVKIGDPLVVIDPEPYGARLAQWQATKQRTLAQLENAKSNLRRDEQLLAQDFATQKQTDETRALVDEYTADLAENEAQIKFAQTQLDFTIIRSPINGRTGIRHVDPGNLIRAADNTNIVTVVQMQPISVIITVSAKALAQAGISPGLGALPVFAYAQDGVTLLDRGQIQTIDNTVDPGTGTIKLKANFPNDRSKLWPGDFVDCKVEVERRRDGLTVPTAAIRHGPKGDFVWIIRPDATTEPRAVGVRQTLGDTALIDRGLQADEKVVVEGQYYLRPGSRVETVKELPGDGPRPGDGSEISGTE